MRKHKHKEINVPKAKKVEGKGGIMTSLQRRKMKEERDLSTGDP